MATSSDQKKKKEQEKIIHERDKSYIHERDKLYEVIQNILNNREELQGLIVSLFSAGVNDSRSSAVLGGSKFAVLNPKMMFDLVSSAGFLQTEIEKIAKVLQGTEELDLSNPPFFLRLLKDGQTLNLFDNNKAKFGIILDNIVPELISVLFKKFGDVGAIDRELKEKQKEITDLPNKKKQLEGLKSSQSEKKNQLQSEGVEGGLDAIKKLESEIKSLENLQTRKEVADFIQSLKKSNVNEKYINDQIAPLVLKPLKELLNNPKDVLEIVNLVISFVTTKYQIKKIEILESIFQKVDFAKILTDSNLNNFLAKEGESLSKIIDSSLKSSSALAARIKPYENELTSGFIKDITVYFSEVIGAASVNEQDIQEIIGLLKPIMIDGIIDKMKLDQEGKREKTSRVDLLEALVKIFTREKILELIKKSDVLVTHQGNIINILVHELETALKKSVDGIKNVKKTEKDDIRALITESMPLVKEVIPQLFKHIPLLLKTYIKFQALQKISGQLAGAGLSEDQVQKLSKEEAEIVLEITKSFSIIFKDVGPFLNKNLPELIQNNQRALGKLVTEVLKQDQVAPLLGKFGITVELASKLSSVALNMSPSVIPLVVDVTQKLLADGADELLVIGKSASALYIKFQEFSKLRQNFISGSVDNETEENKKAREQALSDVLEQSGLMVSALGQVITTSSLTRDYLNKSISGLLNQKSIKNKLEEEGITSEFASRASPVIVGFISDMLPQISGLVQEVVGKKDKLQSIIMQFDDLQASENSEQVSIVKEAQKAQMKLGLVNSVFDLINEDGVKQRLTTDMPKILNQHAEPLGKIIDEFLNDTKIGRNLKITGKQLVQIASERVPQLSKMAELYAKGERGRFGLELFKNIFDKEVIGLVIDGVLSIMKVKIQESVIIDADRRFRIGDRVDSILRKVCEEDRSKENKQKLGELMQGQIKKSDNSTVKYSLRSRDLRGLHFKLRHNFDNFIINNFDFTNAKFAGTSFKDSVIFDSSFKNVEFSGKVSFQGATIDIETLKTLVPAIEKYNDKLSEDNKIFLDGITVVGQLGQIDLTKVVQKDGIEIVLQKDSMLFASMKKIKDALDKHTIPTTQDKNVAPVVPIVSNGPVNKR